MKTSSTAATIVPDNNVAKDRVSIVSRRVALVAHAATEPAAAPPIWEPIAREAGAIPTSSEVLNAAPVKRGLAADLEERLIATLLRPLTADESYQTGNDNRERELRAYFQNVTAVEAYTIRRRLDADRADDKLALAFRRLVVERRVRLKALLADPRRGHSNV